MQDLKKSRAAIWLFLTLLGLNLSNTIISKLRFNETKELLINIKEECK